MIKMAAVCMALCWLLVMKTKMTKKNVNSVCLEFISNSCDLYC